MVVTVTIMIFDLLRLLEAKAKHKFNRKMY